MGTAQEVPGVRPVVRGQDIESEQDRLFEGMQQSFLEPPSAKDCAAQTDGRGKAEEGRAPREGTSWGPEKCPWSLGPCRRLRTVRLRAVLAGARRAGRRKP